MKYVIATLIILFTILLFSYFKMTSTEGLDTYEYKVVDQIGEVEIREYSEAYFNSYKMSNTNYGESSNKGFRALAGYIFGGNEEGRGIAMTSPVVMEMDSNVKMMFMVPSDEDPEKLPAPENDEILLEKMEARKVAAITFSGWANDDIIEKNKKKLLEILDSANVSYGERVSFFGYDPPYKITGRRNEVVVDLI